MILAALATMAFTANIAFAQDAEVPAEEATEQVAEAAPIAEEGPVEVPLTQAIKTKFIEGGPGFMALIVLCLIIGLAFSIERILYLSFSKTNTQALLEKIDAALKKGSIEEAKTVCRETRGPVASIFYQGLLRYDQGLDVVEKPLFPTAQFSRALWRTVSAGLPSS